MKYKYIIGFIIIGWALVFFAANSSASLISTFDSGDEGWSIVDSSGSISYNSVNKWLEVTDTNLNNALQISAPGTFLTTWSPYDSGTLSFQTNLLTDNGGEDWSPFGEVTLKGSAGDYTADLISGVISDSPTTYSIDLTAANFGVSSTQWNNLLGNDLTNVIVNLEALKGDSDKVSFDNFQVAAPVPEPSTMLLLASGIFGFLGLGGRKYFRN